MSSVRMCDKCNTTFSELEDGWQSYAATINRRDPDTGALKEVQMRMDACPSCAMIPTPQFHRELQAAQEGKDLDARIARLERETLDKSEPTPATVFTPPPAAS